MTWENLLAKSALVGLGPSGGFGGLIIFWNSLQGDGDEEEEGEEKEEEEGQEEGEEEEEESSSGPGPSPSSILTCS